MEHLAPWQAFIIGVLATLPAILGGIAGLIYALKKIATVNDTTQQVHRVVNGQRTEMLEEIRVLQATIVTLRLELLSKGEAYGGE